MTVKRHTLMAHQSFPDLPAEVVAASDYDALAARLAEAEQLLQLVPGFGLSAYDHTNWCNARERFLRAKDSADEVQIQPQPKEAEMTTVDSTSDARTINNVMRHGYRVLSDDEKAQMQAIKDKGLELWTLIGSIGESRELSLAKTKAEESVMWAVKHVTR
jgi:hypothetical protein